MRAWRRSQLLLTAAPFILRKLREANQQLSECTAARQRNQEELNRELARAEARLSRCSGVGKRRLQSQLATSSKAFFAQDADLRQRCAALSEAADQLASKALGKGEGTCEKGKSEGESSGKA